MRAPDAPSQARRVLVLDCWTRKALSVVRSLGRRGVEVDCVSHTRIAAPLYSKYATRAFRLPLPGNDPDRYAAAVLDLLARGKYDAIFPLEEPSIAALMAHRTGVEALAALPLPSNDAYAIAADKFETAELARRLGVPAPRTMRAPTLEAALDAGRSIGYPVIAKPLAGSGSRGLRRISGDDELRTYFARVVPEFGEPLLQEAIPWEGTGVGVGLLFDRGRERVSFSYRRLREFPVRGGPSTLRESTDDAAIKAHAGRLLEALQWHGVAMVEFKTDPRDGVAKLMEINPRFWGSLELANAAGVNFPYLLLQVALGHDVTQPQYRTGVRSRWLIPGDIAHFVTNPNRFALDPPFFSSGGASCEEFAGDDVRGGIATIVCAGLSAFRRETWRLGGAR